jgi:hypothetical protein
MRGRRFAIACAGIAVLAVVGWQVVATTIADTAADAGPSAALRVEPRHPEALMAASRNALRAGDAATATSLARRLLAAEPGQGEGFAMVALAAAAQGAPDAGALIRIAVGRAARDRPVRARATADALARGDLPAAMTQLDALLRLGAGTNLFPALVRQSEDPRFATALAGTLAARPRWRNGFMAALLAKGSPQAIDRIHAELRRKGALSVAETGSWLRRMMRDGRWGEAYAHWVATLGPSHLALSPVYDGGFEKDASGIGFDWQEGVKSQGVFTAFEAIPGAGGARAAHFRFIGPAADGDLRQALLLGPGRYRLRLRAKAEFLDSEQGLEWRITCDRGPVVAQLGPIEGSFDWRTLQADFDVPDAGCPGQWLELRNPAAAGAAQHASGDLWVDDVAIVPLG